VSDLLRRIERLEAVAESKVDQLTLNDGSRVTVPANAWLTVANAAVAELAAEYEGVPAPEPSDEEQRLIELYAQAVEDPRWATGERSIAAWARDSVQNQEFS
jgi:hypothetical protein